MSKSQKRFMERGSNSCRFPREQNSTQRRSDEREDRTEPNNRWVVWVLLDPEAKPSLQHNCEHHRGTKMRERERSLGSWNPSQITMPQPTGVSTVACEKQGRTVGVLSGRRRAEVGRDRAEAALGGVHWGLLLHLPCHGSGWNSAGTALSLSVGVGRCDAEPRKPRRWWEFDTALRSRRLIWGQGQLVEAFTVFFFLKSRSRLFAVQVFVRITKGRCQHTDASMFPKLFVPFVSHARIISLHFNKKFNWEKMYLLLRSLFIIIVDFLIYFWLFILLKTINYYILL
jgi:hypothetical protein